MTPDSHLLSLSLMAFLPLRPNLSKIASCAHKSSWEVFEAMGKPSTRVFKKSKEAMKLIILTFDAFLRLLEVVLLLGCLVLAVILSWLLLYEGRNTSPVDKCEDKHQGSQKCPFREASGVPLHLLTPPALKIGYLSVSS